MKEVEPQFGHKEMLNGVTTYIATILGIAAVYSAGSLVHDAVTKEEPTKALQVPVEYVQPSVR